MDERKKHVKKERWSVWDVRVLVERYLDGCFYTEVLGLEPCLPFAFLFRFGVLGW